MKNSINDITTTIANLKKLRGGLIVKREYLEGRINPKYFRAEVCWENLSCYCAEMPTRTLRDLGQRMSPNIHMAGDVGRLSSYVPMLTGILPLDGETEYDYLDRLFPAITSPDSDWAVLWSDRAGPKSQRSAYIWVTEILSSMVAKEARISA